MAQQWQGRPVGGRVQALVAQILLNVTFSEFFDVQFDKYLRRLLVNAM
jgi:hypothetical protein